LLWSVGANAAHDGLLFTIGPDRDMEHRRVLGEKRIRYCGFLHHAGQIVTTVPTIEFTQRQPLIDVVLSRMIHIYGLIRSNDAVWSLNEDGSRVSYIFEPF
jgi:hypothetical protein